MFTDWFRQGGVMMWPLLGCSVLFVAVLIERFWTLGVRLKFSRRLSVETQRLLTARMMSFFKEVPPSIGLLGTVLGVVESFGLNGGRITAEAAGSGLGTACYTTIAGLAIAITATVSEYMLDWVGPGADMYSRRVGK